MTKNLNTPQQHHHPQSPEPMAVSDSRGPTGLSPWVLLKTSCCMAGLQVPPVNTLVPRPSASYVSTNVLFGVTTFATSSFSLLTTLALVALTLILVNWMFKPRWFVVYATGCSVQMLLGHALIVSTRWAGASTLLIVLEWILLIWWAAHLFARVYMLSTGDLDSPTAWELLTGR